MNYELLGAKVHNFHEIAKGMGQKSDFFAIFLVKQKNMRATPSHKATRL
jgi:hypothetical protein